jgi:hypothetical protein
MNKNWQALMKQRAQASKTFFALNQNIFHAPIVAEAWRFGATRTKAYATFVTRKLADQKSSSPV